jgi:ABC-type Zn uptake system ZnuABC Zn-binding protein ZnuA
VAVSIFPIYDIARRVAGDKLDVVCILPPGKSEHDYEPTPKEMAKVADAKLAVLVGFGMDDWARKIVNGAAPSAKMFEIGPKLSPRTLSMEHVGEAAANEARKGADDDGDEKPGAKDPHVWLDPVRMQTAAKALGDAFAELVPSAAADLKARSEKVAGEIGALHADIDKRQAAWKKRGIVTFHGSMSYFADRYHLTIAAVLEPFPGREPTAKYLAEVLAAIEKTKPAALFSEPQLEKGPAKVTAEQAKIPLFELDPVGGTAGLETYEALMRHNAGVLDVALK